MQANENKFPSDADSAFAASLVAMVPATAKLSVATTFYRAGFAAASAPAMIDSPKIASRTRRFALKFAGTLAVGLLVGFLGYQLGAAGRVQQRVPIVDQIAETGVLPTTPTQGKNLVGTTEFTASVATDLQPSLPIVDVDKSVFKSARSSPFSWLLPGLNQKLSLGSLGQRDFDLASVKRVNNQAVASPTISSKPMTTFEMLDVMLAQ